MRSLIVSVLFVSLAFSGTAFQTDWSGSDGVQGPVLDWEDSFWSTDDVVTSNSGKLKLTLIPPMKRFIDDAFNGIRTIHSSDIDGDGDSDVLGASSDPSTPITWWENSDGLGFLWIEHSVDGSIGGASSVYSTDVDGDGDVDILGAAPSDSSVTWWENVGGTGTSWTEHTVDGDFDGAQCVYSSDVDGDGDADILGAAWIADDIVWWENLDGTGTSWTEHTVDGNFNGANSVYSSDIDGDGDADVIGAATTADEITWWENTDGTGTSWTEYAVDANIDTPFSVCCTDVDGDGDIDVLGASRSDDDITWWENVISKRVSWIEHTIDGNFDGATSVYTADFDSDGDADVLGASYNDGEITWWENTDGTGNSWIEHTVEGSYYGASSVYAADIDGDGCTDILGAASSGGDICWWDVMNYSPSGDLESSILDAGEVTEWNTFTSNSEEPVGTSASFQFRSSQDYSNMGVWSDTVFSSETTLSDILSDSTSYLQYRVILETTDPAITPELYEVVFSYIELGIEESSSSSWSLHASENPSYSLFSALVSVPEAGSVDLSLYDVSGRVVAEVSQELPAGTHSVNFTGLAEGVYFCTMRAGEFSATERVVVLK